MIVDCHDVVRAVAMSTGTLNLSDKATVESPMLRLVGSIYAPSCLAFG